MVSCILKFKIVPNASKTEVSGWLGDEIKVRVEVVPEDGKANKALIKFFSKKLGCDKKQIVLEHGDFNPHKRFRFEGLTNTEVLRKLGVEERP